MQDVEQNVAYKPVSSQLDLSFKRVRNRGDILQCNVLSLPQSNKFYMVYVVSEGKV